MSPTRQRGTLAGASGSCAVGLRTLLRCLVSVTTGSYNSTQWAGEPEFSGSSQRGVSVSERPRILVLEGSNHTAGDLLQGSQPNWDLIRVGDPSQGLALLRSERFDGIYADTHDPAVWAQAENLFQAE